MRRVLCLALLAMAPSLGCGGPEETGLPEVVVYSGRNEALIGPLVEHYAATREVEVKVRYGATSELAATLLEEDQQTPADLFISQDAAALGALSRAGLLRPLPEEALERVPSRFASPGGDWLGLSGRARVVVYNTRRISPEELPQGLEEVVDPGFRHRFGIAPANASFQAHMAAYYARHGRERLAQLLAGMAANEPRLYPKNSPIVDAVITGEIDWGLVNHYYLWRALQERPQAPAANFFMPQGEVSSFINLAGAALLSPEPAARELLVFLVSDEAQRYFAQETYEYPLVDGVSPAVELVPLRELPGARLDFGDVAEVLEETLEVIKESGLLP